MGVYMLKQILVVEDDIGLSSGIEASLKSEEIIIHKAHTVKQANELFSIHSFDLVVLDVNLPDGNGIDFLKTIRSISSLPVILLTANDLEIDIVVGLENGANDYITKPFSLAVLRARVNVQLRQPKKMNIFKQGVYYFDFERLEFTVNNIEIDLSKSEQKLLKILTENKGITIERDVLIDYIWTNNRDYVDENALSVVIKRLRTKLGNGSCIKTIYGIGYTWKYVE